jgi:signal peptidase I
VTLPPPDPTGDPDDSLQRRRRREAEASLALAGGGRPDPDPGPRASGPDDPDGPADGDVVEPDGADEAPEGTKSSARNTMEWVLVIAGAIVIAVVIRTFVFQTFWIPSPSMSTTLVENDRVLVNKVSYKLHDVHRGDVIVFERPPSEPESVVKDLIKRVVGLPGETVTLKDGKVRIDGKVLKEPYTNGQDTVPCAGGDPAFDTAEGLKVPEGHVLVMGDNRTNSHDGRCFGPIDEDLIVGRAFFIIWPPSKVGGL